MGRKKSTPQQRLPTAASAAETRVGDGTSSETASRTTVTTDSEVLGRVTFEEGVGVNEFFHSEVTAAAATASRHAHRRRHALNDDSEEESDNSNSDDDLFPSRPTNQRRRARLTTPVDTAEAALVDSEDEQEEAGNAEDIQFTVRSPHRNKTKQATATTQKKPPETNGRHRAATTLNDRLQQILHDQKLKEQEAKALREKRKSVRKSSSPQKKKRIQSPAIATIGDDSEPSIPEKNRSQLELDVVPAPASSDGDVDMTHIIIQSLPPDSEKTHEGIPLYRWSLRKTCLLDSQKKALASHVIHSENGLQKVLSLCIHDESHTKLSNSWEQVGLALAQGTLLAHVNTLQVGESTLLELTIRLRSEQILQLCHPSKVYVQPRGKQQKLQPATVLSRALATMLPESLMANLFPTDPFQNRDSSKTVTAKHVYALVDNAQYNRRSPSTAGASDTDPSQQRSPATILPTSIKGLVPTLRPYQRAAVEWMLQREKQQQPSQQSSGNEWELGWLVATTNGSNHKVMNKALLDFVPLPLFQKQASVAREEQEEILYYCPFTSWWVDSYEEAKRITLDLEENTDTHSLQQCRGGILAESMGLGKTVEVLACILANPSPLYESYFSNSQTATISISHSEISISEHQTHTATASGRNTEVHDDLSAEEEFESNKASEELMEIYVTKDDAAEVISLEFANQTIGTCICGHVINLQEKLNVVVCEECREPMHECCASIDYNNMVSNGKRRTIQYRYGRRILECQMCPKKHCPCCLVAETRTHGKVQSRATLIITPPAILSQWQREIKRHTAIPETVNGASSTPEPLRVIVYPGIRNLCNQSGKRGLASRSPLIHPTQLADADIVLMTFDSLMGDLNHSNENPFVEGNDMADRRTLRQRKVYRVVPSPLLSIQWWRVCLDEAQKIETPTAASARMALKLDATHRWCVTGTPVGRGKLEDLYGLLLFLRQTPFDNKAWFGACFQTGHVGLDGRIQHLLSSAFWRSTKASDRVRTEMGIPEQIEKKVILEFNSVERHFYQRQHEATLNVAAELQTREKAGKRQSTSMMNNLAAQMQKLRAACCHPQVGSSGIMRGKKRQRNGGPMQKDREADIGQGQSRILTMEQILDRLIDDARLKAEEAQRLCLMHNNAMAALSRLKVFAKDRGVTFQDSNSKLIAHSCKLYMESLKLIDDNSKATLAIGEATLTGCTGFQSPQATIRDGLAQLEWKVKNYDDKATGSRELWARFDFEGPPKKITAIRVRRKPPGHDSQTAGTEDTVWLHPKTCIFQVSNPAVGGAFVDAVEFDFPQYESQWVTQTGFRTNRSRSWRLYVVNYYNVDNLTGSNGWSSNIEIELLEPDIGGDSLQRLHALHNASLSFQSLQQIRSDGDTTCLDTLETDDIDKKFNEMAIEAKKIERLYLDGIIPVHTESQRSLVTVVQELENCQQDLFALRPEGAKSEMDLWDDAWWDDILLLTSQLGSHHEQYELCRRVHEDINSAMEGAFDRRQLAQKPFPAFNDVGGLYHALNIRFQDMRDSMPSGSLMKCLKTFLAFPKSPTEHDILESSTCKRCKKDWSWTGPMCAHCKLSTHLETLQPDRLLLLVLGSINSWMKGGRSTGEYAAARATANVDERASFFFEALEATKKAKSAAERAWRVHLDLLNDHDELNMCKGAIRLTQESEDLSCLTEVELNGVVHPIDVAASFLDHQVKQASSLAQLRRHTSTLRYLKNQSRERAEALTNRTKEVGTETLDDNCVLCLCEFRGNRAVLVCGHSFHYSPCLERLMSRSGTYSQHVSCPLRCPVRTKRSEIMVASEQEVQAPRVAPGRKVTGSWGTKVTRLVADVLTVADRGEKSIVFSQWEDMVDVVQEAFRINFISFVRVTSLSKIADCTRRFRSQDCNVLLLNVKNGAEGLTLVEATHVFMVEPLMNCGLDLQAINRIHRIGQTSKTFVHRYLIKDTVEIRIDKWRMSHQEDQLEDELVQSKSNQFKAGGIDGGFNSQEELMSFLTLSK